MKQGWRGRMIAAAILSVFASPALPAALEHPEAQLFGALANVQAGRIDDALSELDQLVKERPTFRLAQMFYSRLLTVRSGGGGDLLTAEDPALAELIEEAKLRMRQWQDGIPENAVPASVMQLSKKHPYAILVDLTNARLYLLRNEGGVPKVVRHFYAAMGKAGAGKQVTGDMRTPIGVYRVTEWLPGEGLPDLYGSGAFPVDYPNSWDRKLGRTGYGIWIHGVPKNTYTRPPRSSEGCVTVANDDLMQLKPYIRVGHTPVLLALEVDWVEPEVAQAEREHLLAQIDGWRSRWSARETDAYLAYYADDFRTGNMSLSRFAAHKRRVNANKKFIDVQLEDLDLYQYPGEENLVLARFTQNYRSDNFRTTTLKEQYWRRNADGQWQIIKEESR